MSLNSSLYTGTSGLKNMGNGMQVVGNNIANTNTVGFKSGRSTFADTLYETVATQSGTAQMGRGMSVGSVTQDFDQGSFESTGNTTDLSIGGEGFFIVRQDGTDNDYYTRAGNFYFDSAGQLVNQEGYIVQGWDLDEDTGEDVGAIGDLVLEAWTSAPDATTEITAITNLDADAVSQAVVLSNIWDSSDDDSYISTGAYEYQTTVSVYDSLGSAHDVTIYYDKKSDSEWEYMVTCDPDEDKRNLVQGTDAEGLLARGAITFSESSGDILDLTMEEFTGRLGNFTANGTNSVDDIEYSIEDYESVALDGYGFELEYNGSEWNFVDQNDDRVITSVDKPDNYGNATIIYSDASSIQIAFDGENEVDLEIQLNQAAVATDSLGFDINAEESISIQGIESLSYTGETANDNTSLEINDPSVMTHDSKDIGIVWDPTTETWYWSNPEMSESAGTLVSEASLDSSDVTDDFYDITNAAGMTMLSEEVTVTYNDTTSSWDWNMDLKEDDFSGEVFDFSPTNDPILTISDPGSGGAIESTDAAGVSTTFTLEWDGSAWTANNGGGQTLISIDSANSDASEVQFFMWEAGNSAGASTSIYSFGTDLTTAGGDSIQFIIDPTPPEEYPDAVLTTSGATTNGFGIDFDADATVDMQFITSADGLTTTTGGLSAVFDVNPDTPPENYANATLIGDQTQVSIDLDNSGDESADDIVFTFEDDLSYGTSTDAYDDRAVINFDILGSTAWTTQEDGDISEDGLFSFTADFLGGNFGTTEQQIELDLGTSFDGSNWINDSLSTTQYSKSSSTTYQDADGYTAGDLENVDVASDGTISGNYSNGQIIPLFRVGLAKFYNNYGLYAEGSNLFSETNDSGEAITNKPGENGLGSISPNSLEMSNVDISDELVKMIEIQRGYQGNSKTITTVDEMLQTVINMK